MVDIIYGRLLQFFLVTALLLLSVNRLNLELSVNEACYINRLARGTGTVVNKEEPLNDSTAHTGYRRGVIFAHAQMMNKTEVKIQ